MKLEELLVKEFGREGVIKLASLIEKRAAQNTQFDETVPAVQGTTPNGETASNSQVSGSADPRMVAEAAAQAAPVVAAPGAPIDPAMDPSMQGPDPAMEGAMAAQNFLAPIMEAAMNGDPNAQAIIAQAAGHIAKGVAEAAAGVVSQPPVAAPAAPVAAPSPEEAVADAVVPDPKKEEPKKPEEKAPDSTVPKEEKK